MPYVFKDTHKRANPDASYTDAAGTFYLKIPTGLLEWVDDPAPPADYTEETYYRIEQDDAPYVAYTRKSAEQIQRQIDDKAKQDAQKHLNDTDYLFSIDRHAELLATEPVRETELRQSRAAARETIRAWKAKHEVQPA